MTLKVAINGFGRIGRNFTRCWLSRGANTGIELVGINGSGDTTTNAHLLKYDSMLGPLRGVDVTTTDNTISLNGKEIKVFLKRWGSRSWEKAEGKVWRFGEQGICEPLMVRFENREGFSELKFHPLTGGVAP